MKKEIIETVVKHAVALFECNVHKTHGRSRLDGNYQSNLNLEFVKNPYISIPTELNIAFSTSHDFRFPSYCTQSPQHHRSTNRILSTGVVIFLRLKSHDQENDLATNYNLNVYHLQDIHGQHRSRDK